MRVKILSPTQSYPWSNTLKKILIIGLGDIGKRLARRWQQSQAHVTSLSRSPQSTATNSQHIVADLDQGLASLSLDSAGAIIYYLAPPANTGEQDLRLNNFLAAIDPGALPKRFIYISTSGVYGDHRGGLVDETTAPNPQNARSVRRLAAEQALQAWSRQPGVDSVILRVGGIYGPGRLPIARLKEGMTVLRRDLAPPTNRIHADDLAMICQAAADAPAGQQIYNVCDMQTSTMSEYFFAIAEYAGLPAPEEVDWQSAETAISPAMMSYLTESRRLDNRKLIEELGISLQYPTLADGLRSCFEQD